jgi:ribosomal protein S27E
MEFPRCKFKPKKDRYAKSRGGPSKFFYIACGDCGEPAIVYQKDGPGRLVRCYVDRIVWPLELIKERATLTSVTVKEAGSLACAACANVLASPMVYEPENRLAYRIIPGSIHAYRSAERAEVKLQKNRE